MANKFMGAVQYDKYGGGAAALKHVEVPVPNVKKAFVLIKVEAAALNHFDLALQRGIFRPLLPFKFPAIPGTDVAGEVVEVGSAVENFKVGDKVVAKIIPHLCGGLAEYALAPECFTFARPTGISAVEAAGLVSATAAYAALAKISRKLRVKGRKPNILITGAATGIGHYAVQLAKLDNMHLTATCETRDIDFVYSLGADEVLDRGASDLSSPSGRPYDAVINHTTHTVRWSDLEPLLTENGIVVNIIPGKEKDLGPLESPISACLRRMSGSKKRNKHLSSPDAKLLTSIKALLQMMAEGKLKTSVDAIYPLTMAEDAWAKLDDGLVAGKIIVEP